MEERRNNGYIDDQARPQQSRTDDGYLKANDTRADDDHDYLELGNVTDENGPDDGYVELGHMNNQNIGHSEQYAIIDNSLLDKNDPRQQTHTYRGLMFDTKDGTRKDTTAPHVPRSAEHKKSGNRVFILIIVVLVVLLVAMAATFGVLYTGGFFDKDGSSATSTTKITETTLTATTAPSTTTTLPRKTTAKMADKTFSSAATTTTKITETTSTSKTAPSTATTLPRTTTEPLSIEERCQAYDGLIPDPDQCQAYYNCSDTYEYPAMYKFRRYLKECDYPQLFNTETMACENFENVDCGDREEFKDACSYIRNQCVRQCRHCEQDFPSCIGDDDGPSMHDVKRWSTFYIICYKERYMGTLVCPTDELFSPEYNSCVTRDFLPPEHGGYKHNCTGKEDGFYPNNMNNCNLYAICSSGVYAGPGQCNPNDVFDEISKTCKHSSSAFTCECSGNC